MKKRVQMQICAGEMLLHVHFAHLFAPLQWPCSPLLSFCAVEQQTARRHIFMFTQQTQPSAGEV